MALVVEDISVFSSGRELVKGASVTVDPGRVTAVLGANGAGKSELVLAIAGMLPIAIGLGTDPSFRAPMAIVVIGGLITSTFLSLLVIPVVFTFVDDAIHWLQRKLPNPHA